MPEGDRQLSVTRHGARVVIRNEHFRVDYDLTNGTWDYIDRTRYKVIRNAYSKVTLEDGRIITTMDNGVREFVAESVTDDVMGKCKRIKFSHKIDSENSDLNLYMKVREGLPYMLINSEIESHAKEEKIAQIALIDISPIYGEKVGGIYLGNDPSAWNVYLNTDSRVAKGTRNIYNGFDINEIVVSGNQYDGVVYDSETKRSIVFGFLDIKKWYSKIELGYDLESQLLDNYNGINKWALFYEYKDHRICRPDTEVTSGDIYLNFSSTAKRAQELYASLMSNALNLPSSDKNIPRWTAFHFSDKVKSKSIVKQAHWIAEHKIGHDNRHSLPEIEYVSVGMGWQKKVGTNVVDTEAFPNGMKEFVEKIHQKGLKVGIWIAPFWIARDASLVQDYPNYILHDAENRMIEVIDPHTNSKAFLLDPSHPGVREYLNRRLREIANDWGFDLIEIDLISHSSDADIEGDELVSYNKSLTSIKLLHSGLNFLKELTFRYSVRFIPHCTSFGFSAGTIFSSDIGIQCHCYQEIKLWDEKNGVKETISNWASRFYLHKDLLTDDLGPLFIENRPLNEALIVATTAALSGGELNISDNLMDMQPEYLEILSKILPVYNEIAEPLDRYEDSYPQIWNLKIERGFEDWNLLALFNWDDELKDISLAFSQIGLNQSESYIIHDFWEEEYVGQFTKKITFFDLPPHSVKLLCVRELQDVPQIISTNIHYTQGGVEVISSGWDERSQTLLVVCKRFNPPQGTMFIYVPDKYVPASTACYGAEYSFEWDNPIHSVKLRPFNDIIHFSITFGKTTM